MKYKLVVLTHGDSEPLLNTLLSLSGQVWPHPTSAYMHLDGPTAEGRVRAYAAMEVLNEWNWTVIEDAHPVGFCRSCHAGWMNAVEGDHEFVLWQEHDLRYAKPVDLDQLASVLDANPQLAQMALMRQPINDAELAAGSVVASRPGQFEPRGGWMEQRSYWTTNVSLFSRRFAANNHWPVPSRVPRNCEGIFGIELREQGYSFGMWGSGEAWTEHVGIRTGWGY